MGKIKSLGDVQLDNRNANKGKPRGQKQIVRSIQRNGFGRSGLLDKNGRAIAGNKTTEAAVEVFGVEVEPIIVQSDGTKPVYVQRTDLDLDDPNPNNPARRLAYEDNLSSWFSFELDPEIVSADMALGFDFEAIDVSLAELGEMLEGSIAGLLGGNGTTPPTDPGPLVDKAEELQKKWQVQPNDLWTIGPHKIICGDCREPETWQRLLSGQKVNGVFTSPPYAEQRKAQYGGVPTAEYVEWWKAVQENVRGNLAEDGSFFVNIKPHCEEGQRVLYVFDLVLAMVRQWGWRFVDELCWQRKGVPGGWSNRFKNEFEPVYQFSCQEDIKFRKYQVGELSGFAFDVNKRHKNHNSVFDCNADNGKVYKEGLALPGNMIVANGKTEQEHNAAFPVSLPTFFIKAYSDPGDLWVDPFLGSGTTIAAAHNEGRIGAGIERLEKYVAVCLERLQQVTGRDPIRLSE